MVGEQFAAKVLKEALGLTPDDTVALQEFICKMREDGPEIMEQIPAYIERAEQSEKRLAGIEKRVQALCFYFKNMDPVKWAEAEQQAIEYFKKKEEKAAIQAPKEG
jgi:hypothetical protein